MSPLQRLDITECRKETRDALKRLREALVAEFDEAPAVQVTFDSIQDVDHVRMTLDVVKVERDRPKLTLLKNGAEVEVPDMPFRIIGGEKSGYKTIAYSTRSKRDLGAREMANEYGEAVLTELWDASHPQDYLNNGWACDGSVEPRGGAS